MKGTRRWCEVLPIALKGEGASGTGRVQVDGRRGGQGRMDARACRRMRGQSNACDLEAAARAASGD